MRSYEFLVMSFGNVSKATALVFEVFLIENFPKSSRVLSILVLSPLLQP
jgi:hypothetical protein